MTRLKHLRLVEGKTAFEICQELKVNATRYSYIERGLLPPRPEEAEALARIFNADPATLFRPYVVRRRQRGDEAR